MYARSYPEKSVSNVPEGYGGSAVRECEPEAESRYINEENINPWERESEAEPVGAIPRQESRSGTSGFGLLSGLFQNGRINLKALGFEEILIIAAAAYMLMSRDGDRECGIMLLILLFI